MLYRLRPPDRLTWCDVPGYAVCRADDQPPPDWEELSWVPAEARAFSNDLLRIAVRYGVRSGGGIVLDARHTEDLGRADELRCDRIAAAHARAELRSGASGQPVGVLGSEDHEWDRTEEAARKAEADLAELLAVPVRIDLVAHWQRLGGRYPD
ncbi:hypothetical protein ABZ342_31515 [Amycolatopsis sp. NPDC005961]|uniref:Uncharacterized protein n=1 Tax=Amycolatopsis camponoti TaxID=2606593 RepID=A0A6I8M8N0_9PSEU|nr:hypothetical protein [Amycolatopsis camponoti]VVJ24306.1 Uncharacterised protein [Amycolatopsis camponoti]